MAFGLSLGATFASAQTATVNSVAVLSASGPPQVEIKTSTPISPATQAAVGPDRIVIDFPGALPADTLKKLSVHRGGLQRVRAALNQSSPPITRVVLDVDGPTDYQVVPNGNSVIIKLVGPTVAAKMAAPVNPQSVVAEPPAVRSGLQQQPPVQFKAAVVTPSLAATPPTMRGPRLRNASLPAVRHSE